MKTVAVLLAVLFVTISSKVAGGKNVFKELKKEIKNLQNQVKEISEKIGPKDPYVKLNIKPVCFGAAGHQPGKFEASAGGKLIKIKLVHLFGYVACAGTSSKFWSHWGCGYYNQDSIFDWTSLYVTTAENKILFPPKEINRGAHNMALIPGYNSRSPEIVMSVFATPIDVSVGQELRLWYTEDLENNTTGDNHGRVCADVYGYFM